MEYMILVFFFLFSILGAVIVISLKRKDSLNYYLFFIAGVIWTLMGILMFMLYQHLYLLGLGIVFLLYGLKNRSSWRTNWEDFEKNDRNVVYILVGMAVALLLLAFLDALSLI